LKWRLNLGAHIILALSAWSTALETPPIAADAPRARDLLRPTFLSVWFGT
jgi:hypothetical protein